MTVCRHLHSGPRRALLVAGVAALGAALAPAAAAEDRCGTFEVTIRNENRGQNFSPPAIVVHRPGFGLFELERPASEPLWRLAEDGDTSGYRNPGTVYHFPDLVSVVLGTGSSST